MDRTPPSNNSKSFSTFNNNHSNLAFQSPYIDNNSHSHSHNSLGHSHSHNIGSPATPLPPSHSQSNLSSIPQSSRIYSAVYSGVGVYEAMIRGIAVMRRRADGYMNATQILKVAGVDKGRRTKILEREILPGLHEKIQGGFGRYQGTWIPFERGFELAVQYGCDKLLQPIFEFNPSIMPPSAGRSAKSPQKLKRSAALSPTQEKHSSSISILNNARSSGIFVNDTDVDLRKDRSPLIKKGRFDNANENLMRSSKPYAPPPGTNAHLLTRTQHSLSLLFQQPQLPTDITPDAILSLDVNKGTSHPDLVIDELGHTALHWSASLARLSTLSQLLKAGSDPKRGNIAGETPLHRSVLVTDNYDKKTFPNLLSQLKNSLRTLDNSGRTILHHIALIAAVSGRPPSARYYMENVLEFIALYENGDFKSVIDIQDEHGDTSLNICARVGNKNLVRMLIEAGANKSISNKLGLKPSDFGVESDDLNAVSTDDMISNLQPPQPTMIESSQVVLNNIHTQLKSITDQYSNEIDKKNENLSLIQLELKNESKELSEFRKQKQNRQNKSTELAELEQKIKNVNEAIEIEKKFNWSLQNINYDNNDNGNNEKEKKKEKENDINESSNLLNEIPTENSLESLIKLKKLNEWLNESQKIIDDKVNAIDDVTVSKEIKYRSIVSVCTGVPVDQVEGMLEQLLAAMESDNAQSMDMNKVSEFLSRVQ